VDFGDQFEHLYGLLLCGSLLAAPSTLRSGGALRAMSVAPQRKNNTSTTIGRSKADLKWGLPIQIYSDDDCAFAAFILAAIILREVNSFAVSRCEQIALI
jgi:hypothetical protein